MRGLTDCPRTPALIGALHGPHHHSHHSSYRRFARRRRFLRPWTLVLSDTSNVKAFSEQQATGLVGKSVVKRVLSEENPAVKPGQIGKVVEVFETSIAEGFGIVVDWGNGEMWWYENSGQL